MMCNSYILDVQKKDNSKNDAKKCSIEICSLNYI